MRQNLSGRNGNGAPENKDSDSDYNDDGDIFDDIEEEEEVSIIRTIASSEIDDENEDDETDYSEETDEDSQVITLSNSTNSSNDDGVIEITESVNLNVPDPEEAGSSNENDSTSSSEVGRVTTRASSNRLHSIRGHLTIGLGEENQDAGHEIEFMGAIQFPDGDGPSRREAKRRRPSEPNAAQGTKISRVVQDDQVPTCSRFVSSEEGTTAAGRDDEDGEDTTCTICMEPFTNSGSHRICCLKCGHVFGFACIEKWLLGQKLCPMCNSKAIRSDIRLLFTKNLKAIDTAELDRTKKELERVKMAKEKLNLELHKVQIKSEQKDKEIMSLKSLLAVGSASTSTEYPVQVQIDPDLKEACICPKFVCNLINKEAVGFRVGAFCYDSATLVVSQTIESSLYPSGAHGIRRVRLTGGRYPKVVFPLHQKQIRDLTFSQYSENTLLTVSIDKKAILSNVDTNVILHTFLADMPLWSCAWDSSRTNMFYAGTSNGKILVYDVRNPNDVLNTLVVPSGENNPVARIHFIGANRYGSEGRKVNGLLIQKLDSVWNCDIKDDGTGEFKRLPLEGSFTNVDYDPKSELMLVSSRPSAKHNQATNLQSIYDLMRLPCHVDEGDYAITCNEIRSLELPQLKQSLMTRSKLWTPVENVTVVASDWSEQEELIWIPSTNSTMRYQKNRGPILDYVPGCWGNKSPVVASVSSDTVKIISLEQGFKI